MFREDTSNTFRYSILFSLFLFSLALSDIFESIYYVMYMVSEDYDGETISAISGMVVWLVNLDQLTFHSFVLQMSSTTILHPAELFF